MTFIRQNNNYPNPTSHKQPFKSEKGTAPDPATKKDDEAPSMDLIEHVSIKDWDGPPMQVLANAMGVRLA
jgi:hypothetical protein